MIGLRMGFSYFLIAASVVSLVANVSTSFGYLISCASSSISMALSVGPPVIIPFLIFGGFFLNAGSVPAYFEWLSYLSWFRYGNEALLINQWTGVTDIICTRSNATCPSNGKVILETLNFSPVSVRGHDLLHRAIRRNVDDLTILFVPGQLFVGSPGFGRVDRRFPLRSLWLSRFARSKQGIDRATLVHIYLNQFTVNINESCAASSIGLFSFLHYLLVCNFNVSSRLFLLC